MAVRRIIMTIAADNLAAAQAFYGDVLGLEKVMDHGWIITFAGDTAMQVQISIASEGGSGTPVPDVSIEVEDVEAVLARCRQAAMPILYGPANEPWGVRRFFVRDPFGRLVNILEHR